MSDSTFGGENRSIAIERDALSSAIISGDGNTVVIYPGLTQLAQRDRNFIVFTYYVKVAYPEGIAEINNSNWLC
jgi:hypothetical protein